MHCRSLAASVKNTKGASLIVTLGLTLVLMLLASGVTKLIDTFTKNTSQVERANKAYFAAESGIELALYDLSAYKDGYEVNPNVNNCGAGVDLTANTDFGDSCDNTDSATSKPYRFVNFTGSDSHGQKLSQARGFWRLFSQTRPDRQSNYVIPNPYFVGDKDGLLETDNGTATSSTTDYLSGENEWGTLTKNRPISLSLMIDNSPNLNTNQDPAERYDYLASSTSTKVILMIDPADTRFNSNSNGSDDEIVAWTLSAVDGIGEEYTLQGVVYDSDISDTCTADGATSGGSFECFVLDFSKDRSAIASSTMITDDYALAGEDINKNIGNGKDVCPNADCVGDANNQSNWPFNRVSAIPEVFNLNTIKEFLTDMNTAKSANTSTAGFEHYGTGSEIRWTDARLSLNLIGTLSETSGTASDTLRYKIVSDEPLADEYTYIVSEGFSVLVKQTIETRFLRQSAIPIFSYVIFQ